MSYFRRWGWLSIAIASYLALPALACRLSQATLAAADVTQRRDLITTAYRQLLHDLTIPEIDRLVVEPLTPPGIEAGRSELDRMLGEFRAIVDSLDKIEREKLHQALRVVAEEVVRPRGGSREKRERIRKEAEDKSRASVEPDFVITDAPYLAHISLLPDAKRFIFGAAMGTVGVPPQQWPRDASSFGNYSWYPDSGGKFALEVDAQKRVARRWVDLSTPNPQTADSAAAVPVPLADIPADIQRVYASEHFIVFMQSGKIQVFDLSSGQAQPGPVVDKLSNVKAMAADGKSIWVHRWFARNPSDNSVSRLQKIDLATGKELASVDLPGTLADFSVDVDGTLVVAQLQHKGDDFGSNHDYLLIDATTAQVLSTDNVRKPHSHRGFLLRGRSVLVQTDGVLGSEVTVSQLGPKRLVGKGVWPTSGVDNVAGSPDGKKILFVGKTERGGSWSALYDLDAWLERATLNPPRSHP